MDIGQPKDFISGTGFYLNFLRKLAPKKLAQREGIVGNVLVVSVFSAGEDSQMHCSYMQTWETPRSGVYS